MISKYSWTFISISIAVILITLLLFSYSNMMIGVGKSVGKSVGESVDRKSVTRNEVIREAFKESLAQLKSTCVKYKSNHTTPPLKNFSLEPRHKLVICRTAKHGSTSWTNNFVKIYEG